MRNHWIVSCICMASVFLTVSFGQAAALDCLLITDRDMEAPALHGIAKLESAFRDHGIACKRALTLDSAPGDLRIVAGLASGGGPAAKLHETLGISKPSKEESLLIRRVSVQDSDVLLVSGADARGLMYALLDVADRVAWAADSAEPLSEVRDAEESPAVSERALSIYTMHQGCFESRFYDEAYWERYLDMLAENRFNTFALLFGYENAGYFAPPYPHFFDVEDLPAIQVVGMTPEKQAKNVKALKQIIRMAHDRGLDFTLGIWDHVYRGGVQGPTERAEKPTEGVIWGLDQENLVPYTQAALTKFLKLFPELDAIQFRMHGESGLTRGEMGGFWETVYGVMKEHGSHMRFDARAKNFPDELIYKALDMGLDMRICTKYWMEQMGMPYHPAHVHPKNQHDRRHGYADLLRYPQRYKMHWRLWNGGTTRVLLWGDPEYVRRFAESTHLYGGEGFEVVEPMGTKMQDSPHTLPPFALLNEPYRYYDWEFERYWHFYQVFGRVGYNPDTPAEVWEKEFEQRFGSEAGPLLQEALHLASNILPRLNTYVFPYDKFPTTRGWAGKQRWKDLPDYAAALPGDTQIFQSIGEAAEYYIEGKASAKVHPGENSIWLSKTSKKVLSLVEQAEASIGEGRNKEFVSTVTDLKILAHLAAYHSERIVSGLRWAAYERSQDLFVLDSAISHEGRAVKEWRSIVEAAGDVYTDNMMMGRESVGLSGHWRDELVELERGLAELKETRKKAFEERAGKSLITHVPARKVPPLGNIEIFATVSGFGGAKVSVKHRSGGGPWESIEMEETEPCIYTARILSEEATKYFDYYIEVSGEGVQAAFPEGGAAAPLRVTVTDDWEPPALSHAPIQSAPINRPLTVRAKVTDPSGVAWVRLRYRHVNQTEDYETLAMAAAGEPGVYEATVPAEATDSEWDFMYLFEVMDTVGNGKIYPDFEEEAPYVIVHLER